MKHLKYFLALAGVLAVSSINALAISYSAATDGLAAPSGMSFQALPGGSTLGLKTQYPTTIIGIVGGDSSNEIDLGQTLRVSFTTPQYVSSLSLGLLYNGPEYNDYNEIAGVYVGSVSGTQFTLTITGDLTAVWSFAGASVTNVSPAVEKFGGEWKITNPFGLTLVSDLYFTPIANPGQGFNKSDFGLSKIETRNSTPDSGSMAALLGMSLLAIGVAGQIVRRRIA